MNDDVDELTKSKRLTEIIDEQQNISYEINQELIGTETIILIEGFSKKSNDFLAGRTDTNKVVIIPNENGITKSDYVKVKINRATSGTLFADFINKVDIKEQSEQKIA
jgi:tRNA-2-methylthio-N6-dimethylallyladenosine synthase